MPSKGYEVKLISNNEIQKIFPSIQEAYRYVREQRPDYTREEAFNAVNHSIDDNKSWSHSNKDYLFVTSEAIRIKRASRKTR
jgi:hypothetical protein